MSTLPPVELGVLGPLQVRQGGAPVVIPGAKPRAILTMLGLHHGSVVSADTLIELLWGDEPPRTAAKALQTHISGLRRALGDGVVVTEGAGWRLAGPGVVDASRYRAAARLGRDAAAAGDTGQAVARIEEAVALWRGIPMLPEGQRGLSEKTRWIEGHAALVEDRADALLATGRAAEVVGDLEAAVAEAPLRERRWGQLMLALYRAGRQGEALGAYQRARSHLADELGVDPGPELRRLEAAIVAQDPSLDLVVVQDLPSVTRAVTFLLTDIEGSTAAWESDADAMAVALARHDELVDRVVTARGGRLIKTRGEGDATFSVFDRPSAAASAAIELQDAISHEPWELAAPMRIRVALHTGEVEFRDGDYFGRAVNRVARLRSLAEGGQILCSGAVAELVIDSLPDDVVLADLGMRQLRNLARPEHVFELRMERPEDIPQRPADVPMQRPDLPAVLVGAGPFVGRDRELDRLLATWQAALVGGVSTVLVAGEPGVGKTRLAGEWSQRAYEQGALVLYGRCDEDLGVPYQPFAEALRSLAPCLGADRLRGLRGVEALLALVPGLADVVQDLAAPTRADPDTERYALFDAVVAVLGIASARAPILLVLDDLHWAAKPTLLLLRHLLRFGDRARVQIVGTYRSTDLDRSHPLAAMLADLHRDGTGDRLALSGLDEDDVTAYVAEAGYDDEELAHALASVTGGNPFFLIEALRHVDESGGVWDQSTLPQGVRDAVGRRLSRLPIETNKALAAAAVVGSRFALEFVENVVGGELIDAFDEACQAGIVIEEPGGFYRFNHAIVRQSLLAELASVRRMRLHQRIATALEALPGAEDELVAELAHHYFECAWAGNAPKAVFYCRRAADQAMARLAFEGAADLYHHALHALEEIDDELPDRDEQAAELLVARCEALLAAGDVTSAVGAVAQLRKATTDSARLAAWATCFEGQLSMLTHPERLDEIESALGVAAEQLAGLGDAAGEAKAHTVRAASLARLGRIGDCEVALDDALTAARRAREHRRVNAVLAGAPLAALWGPNPVPRAGGRCLDVVRLLRITTDSPAVEATSTRCQAVLEAFRGRDAAARRMIESARRTVTELGLRHARLEVEQFAGIVELVAGDPAAAEPHLRKAYNGFRRMGLDADTAETAALLGRACLTLDRDAEADELCMQSERLAGHALKPSIAWRMLRAELSARRGDSVSALPVAEAAVALAAPTDLLVDHGDACLSLATILATAGDLAGARAAADRAADLYDRKGAAALANKARHVRGALDVPPAGVPPQPLIVEPETAWAKRATRRLENAASRAYELFQECFVSRDWAAMAEALADGAFHDDQRPVVGGGLRIGRDAAIAEMSALAEIGVKSIGAEVIATRGDRLVLGRALSLGRDRRPDAFRTEVLNVAEIDGDGRISALITFGRDDFESAIEALDARYLAGEAVVHVRTWSAITQVFAALNRGELPTTTSDMADVDHRSSLAMGAGDLMAYLRDALESSTSVQIYVVAVHRLTEFGAVVTHAANGTTGDGFEAEWLLTDLIVVEDDLVSRCEMFDESDVDLALARFEELTASAPRLENTASRAYERYRKSFAASDWDALTALLAEDICTDDRRRMVGAGVRRGRDAEIDDLRTIADIGVDMTAAVVATRGDRIALTRACFATSGQPYVVEVFGVIEVDAIGRIVARVGFDLDDADAAYQELERRYLAAEAAPYAQVHQLAIDILGEVNRHQPGPLTARVAYTDHRRVSFGSKDFGRAVEELWALVPDARYRVTTVHAIGGHGLVASLVIEGADSQGNELQWFRTLLLDFAEPRLEVYEDSDVDAALARFEEIRPRRLENAASRAYDTVNICFSERDWAALGAKMSVDVVDYDRRRGANSGVRGGREAVIASLQVAADLGAYHIGSTAVAIRGDRLALCRLRFSGRDHRPEAFYSEALGIVEVCADERLVTNVLFDPDDLAAALEELDARYRAGEAANHARTWSVVSACFASLSRHEMPSTTGDLIDIDHRTVAAFGVGELRRYVQAGWDINRHTTSYVEVVHRLDDLGAVVTHAAELISNEGFEAEWRTIDLLGVQGERLSRVEIFDEADLDAALARFDEIRAQPRCLENAATQVAERFPVYWTKADWVSMAQMLAADVFIDDRRRGANAGVRVGRDAAIEDVRAAAEVGFKTSTTTVVATRGERLDLVHMRLSQRDRRSGAFELDSLHVVDVDDDGRMRSDVIFGLDDLATAFEELDARYLAGEAAIHARTWSVIAGLRVGFNRQEPPVTTPDWVFADHRHSIVAAAADLPAGLQMETVHRLSDLGAVVTHVAHGISSGVVAVEWRMVSLFAVAGELISRCELFDEADLEVALAKFDELNGSVAH